MLCWSGRRRIERHDNWRCRYLPSWWSAAGRCSGCKFQWFRAPRCNTITDRTGCGIPIAVTTNGVLINDAWADYEADGISVAISMDGPSHIHDAHRKTFQGGGTHAAAERAARMLLARDVAVSALAVCNPEHSPKDYTDFFADCGIEHYDIMIPDATVDEKPASIAAFYNGLFDRWLEANRDTETVEIRTITDMVAALLGKTARPKASATSRWNYAR